MLVYAVVSEKLSPTSPLGEAIDVFVQREDAERFIEEVRGDDPDLASYLRIDERELEVADDTRAIARGGDVARRQSRPYPDPQSGAKLLSLLWVILVMPVPSAFIT